MVKERILPNMNQYLDKIGIKKILWLLYLIIIAQSIIMINKNNAFGKIDIHNVDVMESILRQSIEVCEDNTSIEEKYTQLEALEN